ncbi:MAG: hypothetical protein ACREJN_06605 [Nitrospiraceae bacterium]
MRRHILWLVAVSALWWISGATIGHAAAGPEQAHPQLILGDRVLLGTVDEISGGRHKSIWGRSSLGSSRWACEKMRPRGVCQQPASKLGTAN